MSFLSKIFGGSGSTQTTTQSTNVSVSVSPEITNEIYLDDSRLQSMVDAIVAGNDQDRAVALATASAQVEIAKVQAEQAKADRVADEKETGEIVTTIRDAVIFAAVGLAFTMMLGRGRAA